jgi:hypothetical protein
VWLTRYLLWPHIVSNRSQTADRWLTRYLLWPHTVSNRSQTADRWLTRYLLWPHIVSNRLQTADRWLTRYLLWPHTVSNRSQTADHKYTSTKALEFRYRQCAALGDCDILTWGFVCFLLFDLWSKISQDMSHFSSLLSYCHTISTWYSNRSSQNSYNLLKPKLHKNATEQPVPTSTKVCVFMTNSRRLTVSIENYRFTLNDLLERHKYTLRAQYRFYSEKLGGAYCYSWAVQG